MSEEEYIDLAAEKDEHEEDAYSTTIQMIIQLAKKVKKIEKRIKKLEEKEVSR